MKTFSTLFQLKLTCWLQISETITKIEKNCCDILGIPKEKKFSHFFFQVGCPFPLNWSQGIQILQNFWKIIIFGDVSTYFGQFWHQNFKFRHEVGLKIKNAPENVVPIDPKNTILQKKTGGGVESTLPAYNAWKIPWPRKG